MHRRTLKLKGIGSDGITHITAAWERLGSRLSKSQSVTFFDPGTAPMKFGLPSGCAFPKYPAAQEARIKPPKDS